MAPVRHKDTHSIKKSMASKQLLQKLLFRPIASPCCIAAQNYSLALSRSITPILYHQRKFASDAASSQSQSLQNSEPNDCDG